MMDVLIHYGVFEIIRPKTTWVCVLVCVMTYRTLCLVCGCPPSRKSSNMHSCYDLDSYRMTDGGCGGCRVATLLCTLFTTFRQLDPQPETANKQLQVSGAPQCRKNIFGSVPRTICGFVGFRSVYKIQPWLMYSSGTRAYFAVFSPIWRTRVTSATFVPLLVKPATYGDHEHFAVDLIYKFLNAESWFDLVNICDEKGYLCRPEKHDLFPPQENALSFCILKKIALSLLLFLYHSYFLISFWNAYTHNIIMYPSSHKKTFKYISCKCQWIK